MAAQCGGRPCDQEEVTERVEVCNKDPCPVADICVWSSWDSWGDWSLSFNIIEARSVSIFSRILLLRPKQFKSFHIIRLGPEPGPESKKEHRRVT